MAGTKLPLCSVCCTADDAQCTSCLWSVAFVFASRFRSIKHYYYWEKSVKLLAGGLRLFRNVVGKSNLRSHSTRRLKAFIRTTFRTVAYIVLIGKWKAMVQLKGLHANPVQNDSSSQLGEWMILTGWHFRLGCNIALKFAPLLDKYFEQTFVFTGCDLVFLYF